MGLSNDVTDKWSFSPSAAGPWKHHRIMTQRNSYTADLMMQKTLLQTVLLQKDKCS